MVHNHLLMFSRFPLRCMDTILVTTRAQVGVGWGLVWLCRLNGLEATPAFSGGLRD